MIDERKLIAKLENWAKESKEASGLKEPALLQKVIEEAKDMAVNEEIKVRIEREDSDSGWIPVSERVPDHERTVIVTAQGKRERLTALDNYVLDLKDWETFSNDDDGEAIAWMPLPEPYGKGE